MDLVAFLIIAVFIVVVVALMLPRLSAASDAQLDEIATARLPESAQPGATAVMTYRGKYEQAMAEFRKDQRRQAAAYWYPISQNYVPGTWGCGAWILAFLALVLLVGIIHPRLHDRGKAGRGADSDVPVPAARRASGTRGGRPAGGRHDALSEVRRDHQASGARVPLLWLGSISRPATDALALCPDRGRGHLRSGAVRAADPRSRILGHTSVATTATFYGHIQPAMLKRSADRMDALLAAAAGT